MKTQYYTAASLDGFIATEDDSLEWLFPLGDIDDTGYPDFIAEVGALAMGSSSRSLPPILGAGLHFVRGDVRPVHAAMRAAAGGRNLWVVGGVDLAGQFHDAGLLDEIIVQVGPGFAELRYDLPAPHRG